MIKNKIITCVLAILFCCVMFTNESSSLVTQVFAEETYVRVDGVIGGGIYFDSTTGTVTKADKEVTIASLPNAIDGVVIKNIGDFAFWGCEELTSVTIPSGVVYIGDRAFSSCSKLTSVIIPSSVTTIGTSAFFECTSLNYVEIPKSVTSIGFSAFSNCTSLTNITIPSSITSISSSLFSGCTGLKSITIPKTVTKIEYEAFNNCTNLTNINFTGSSSQWSNVSIATKNTAIDNAKVNYESSTSENNTNYTFSEILKNSNYSNEVSAITKAVEKDGDITAIYNIGEGIYYIILDDGSEVLGSIVKTVLKNSEKNYIVNEFTNILASQAELTQVLNQYITTSNITLNYDDISEFKNSEDSSKAVSLYIENALNNISGITLNDVSKGEIATFASTAITQHSAMSIEILENYIEIDLNILEFALNNAESTKNEVETLLKSKGIELNKAISTNIILAISNADLEKDIKILIGEDLKDMLNGASLQILLDDGNHAINITDLSLNSILEENGSTLIEFKKIAQDSYTCEFYTSNDQLIEQISAHIGVMLPTDNQFSTVIANFLGNDENWGGQYDTINKTITFQTSYSGKYMIIDNSVEILDIDDKYKTELLFMASKGFFELDNYGNFRPLESLTRYEFTKALIKMFFALDTNVETTFEDVSRGSPYYSYVASAEAGNIVDGYADGTFMGDDPISTEQVLVLIARTLGDIKGYNYPANSHEYLTWIFGAENTSDWANTQMSLSIREGIVLPDEAIVPAGEITRESAAVYLYRLFMLLEEVNVTTFEVLTSDITTETQMIEQQLAESEGLNLTDKQIMIISCIGVALALIIVMVIIYIFLKKREEKEELARQLARQQRAKEREERLMRM